MIPHMRQYSPSLSPYARRPSPRSFGVVFVDSEKMTPLDMFDMYFILVCRF